MRFLTKLSALFSAIFLIACLVISYTVYISNIKTLEEQIRDSLEDQAFHITDKIDRMLFERYADMKFLAADSVISSRSSTPKQIAERLIECQNEYKIYASLSFFDLNRVRIADTSGRGVGKQNPFEDYWKDIAEGKDSVIDIHKSVTLNRVVFHFVNLVKDKNGSAFGVVVSRMPVENLYDIVKKASGIHEVEETLKIDLLNKDGLILYSNYNRKGILKEISPDWESAKRFLSTGKKIGSERHPYLREEEISTFAKEQGYLDFRGNDWTLTMHVPTKVVFASAIELRNRTIMILLIIGVLALFIIFLFSRTITKPMAKLINASVEIGKGNLDAKVEVTSKDEIGQLAAMFNKMVRDLKESQGNLLVRSNELENANETLQAEITQRKQTEEALRESEERFRPLTESANEAIITVDSSGKIIFWNKGAEEIFGYSADEALGKPYNFTVPERFHENHQKRMKYFISMGKSAIPEKAIEGIGVRKDGSEFLLGVSNSIWKTKEGTFLTAIIRDITKRKEIENEIKETRDFLENIFEATQDGIMISDPSGYIVRINRALEEMLGFTQDEIIRKHTAELAPQDEKDRIIGDHLITDLIEKGFTKNFETAWLRKDGSLCPIELNVTRIVDREGNKAGAVSVIRDITERKKAEEEIKTAKDFLESVIESSRDGIMICNEKGYILSVNTALSTMSSFSKEELIGEHPSIFTIDERDIRKKVLEKQGELFEKGSVSYESISRTKEGKIINIECNSAMIKDENGNYTGGVSIVRDVTERKKMEQQLIRSEKLRSLGELAGGVAHDFNNVLAAILGRAQLLSKVLDSPEGIPEKRESVHELKKGLELIEKAALDGAETVRRIQEFSRKKDEKDDTYFTEVDVNKVINDALEFTKARWKDAAESKGINIDVERNLLPVPLVSGSASELREVLTNIINNALDAMPQGGEMRVTTFRENSSVTIKIEDTGIGIPEEIKDRIFDPFFTTKGPQSTGLGMSVSYGIINRHKGIITVDSMEGKGSTFTIILPVIDERKRKEKEEKSKLVTDKLKKTSVLIIDDEEAVRNLLCDILMEDGHEVEVACNGSEGIELFKRKEFDLVFTDLGMPGMSGWQVAEEIKKIRKSTPVALITGWKINPQESQKGGNGVDLIVNKPFQLDQVLRLVHEAMEIRKRLGNN